MTNTVFKNSAVLFVVVLFTLSLLDAATPDRPIQRRRRPFFADFANETEGSGPRFFPLQRRGLNKTIQTTTSSSINNSLQADIAQSCKSEPGCEWSCFENAFECICRCKFNPSVSNSRASQGSGDLPKTKA